MDKLNIEFELPEHGWSIVKFTNQHAQCEGNVSFLNNSIEQLVDMALELKRGLATTKACFFDEPGELQFIVNLEENYPTNKYGSLENSRRNRSRGIPKTLGS